MTAGRSSAPPAVRELEWRGDRILKHALVLLDLWGHNHDERLWGDPLAFRPDTSSAAASARRAGAAGCG